MVVGDEKLAVGVIGESGSGVFESHGVSGVRGGEGVTCDDGVFHELFALFAASNGFFVLDLGLSTTHLSLSLYLTSYSFGSIESNQKRYEREEENKKLSSGGAFELSFVRRIIEEDVTTSV